MKCFLIAAILLSATGFTLAQQDITPSHAAYHRCVVHIETDLRKAYESCSDYLNKYPNDNRTLLAYARKFVDAHKRISQYLESVPMTSFAEITPGWAIYSPGLLTTIPSVDSRGSKYPIVIKREYGSPDEEKLLAKAESLYKNPQGLELEILKEWRRIAEAHIVLPDGEPKWWTGTADRILPAELVTTQAVLYYYNVSQDLGNKQGKFKERSPTYLNSSLDYKASIKKMDVYERSGKSFNNVYVANMTLTWAQVCGTLCGYGFTRNKIVVMSPSGEVLELFLDDPANRLSWIS